MKYFKLRVMTGELLPNGSTSALRRLILFQTHQLRSLLQQSEKHCEDTREQHSQQVVGLHTEADQLAQEIARYRGNTFCEHVECLEAPLLMIYLYWMKSRGIKHTNIQNKLIWFYFSVCTVCLRPLQLRTGPRVMTEASVRAQPSQSTDDNDVCYLPPLSCYFIFLRGDNDVCYLPSQSTDDNDVCYLPPLSCYFIFLRGDNDVRYLPSLSCYLIFLRGDSDVCYLPSLSCYFIFLRGDNDVRYLPPLSCYFIFLRGDNDVCYLPSLSCYFIFLQGDNDVRYLPPLSCYFIFLWGDNDVCYLPSLSCYFMFLQG